MLPSAKGGSATSSSRAEFATPGNTVIARILKVHPWSQRRIPAYMRRNPHKTDA
jgi:hypothetical protein